MSLVITKNDIGSVICKFGHDQDDVLKFAGAGTVAAGTILARGTSDGKLIPFVKGGSTDGNGVPKAVLTYEVSATGAGDVPVRALVNGTLIRSRLVIAADGDASNVDAAVIDQMRDYGLLVEDTKELNNLDNQ